jgi:hypothetical protein
LLERRHNLTLKHGGTQFSTSFLHISNLQLIPTLADTLFSALLHQQSACLLTALSCISRTHSIGGHAVCLQLFACFILVSAPCRFQYLAANEVLETHLVIFSFRCLTHANRLAVSGMGHCSAVGLNACFCRVSSLHFYQRVVVYMNRNSLFRSIFVVFTRIATSIIDIHLFF